MCIGHGGGKRCTDEGCDKSAVGGTAMCVGHGGDKRCIHEGCDKSAARGGTAMCKAHGGGKRCTHEGCVKSAQGGTAMCKRHGGGKRCTHEGCDKSARGGTAMCMRHGGGKRCSHEGCDKSAQGRTAMCKGHGGGKQCTHEGCDKSAQGGTASRVRDGGGNGGIHCRCEGCDKSAQVRDSEEEAGAGVDEGTDPDAGDATKEIWTKEGTEGAQLLQNSGELYYPNFSATQYDEQEYNILRNEWLVEQHMCSGERRDLRVKIATSGLSHSFVSTTLELSRQATTDEERMQVLIVLRALKWWMSIGAAQRKLKPAALLPVSSVLDSDDIVAVASTPSQEVPALVAPTDLTKGQCDLEKPDPDQEQEPATKRAKYVADGSRRYTQPDKDPEVPDGYKFIQECPPVAQMLKCDIMFKWHSE